MVCGFSTMSFWFIKSKYWDETLQTLNDADFKIRISLTLYQKCFTKIYQKREINEKTRIFHKRKKMKNV